MSKKTAKRPDLDTKPMIELYQQGLSATQIAKKFGLVKSAVSARLKKAGVTLRTSSDYEGRKRYWQWKGDNYITPITRKRNQLKHRKWSRAVMQRDQKQCQDCGVKGKRLHAHHLISLKECINTYLEFAVENGTTLCVPCHGKRHTRRIGT